MPQGKDYPGDGHLLVRESLAAPLTPEILQQMVNDDPYQGEYSLVHFGADTGLLVQGNGIGRVVLLHGDIRIDISGPAVTPDAVQAVAAKVAQANS